MAQRTSNGLCLLRSLGAGRRLQRHGHDHLAHGSNRHTARAALQTLAGIRSVLDEQAAELIGGHTMESRSAAPVPASFGVQIALTVNGSSKSPWLKSGLRPVMLC